MAERARVANSLEEAKPDELVHLDRKGRVRSGAVVRVTRALYWGILAALIAVEGYLGYSLLGWPGLSIALVLGGYVSYFYTRMSLLTAGTRCIAKSDLDAAAGHFGRAAKSKVTPRHIRARAWAGLATIARIEGDDALALERIERAIALGPRRFRRRALARIPHRFRAQVLASLGRTAEARAALEEIGAEVPEGDFEKLSYYGTGLYLAFHEGRHDLDDEALHEQAKFALGITVAAPLLALLSWAFTQNGDEEMAELLRDEALDRHPGKMMSGPMPKLDAWLKREGESGSEPRLRADSAEDLAEDFVEDARVHEAVTHRH